MNFMLMLLLLLAVSVVFGAIRKLRGGTFLPIPGSEGDHHVQDKTGRWWLYDAEDKNTVEELFRRRKRKR